MRYRIAMTALSLWITGVFLGSFSVDKLPIWYWTLLLTVPLLALKKRAMALLFLALLLGFGYSRVWRRWYWRSFPNEALSFSGKVSAIPDLRDKNQYLIVKTQETLAQTTERQPEMGFVLVKADRYLPVGFGDILMVQGTLEAPEKFDQFNYPLFLERDHVFAIVPQAKVRVIEKNARPSLVATLANLRSRLEQVIGNYIPEPESSFLSGLLFGSKRAIPSDITNALQATSTSHLVAISGANITFITAMALGVFPISNRAGQALLVILVSGALSLLTGAPASVVRGAIISSTGSIVKAVGRRAWPLATILLAASIMLLTNPLLLRSDPGFQLSFAAYAGLLLFANGISSLMSKFRVPAAVSGSATETCAATLGTAPLSIMAGSFALRGLLVNPLVLWLIPPATALGFMLLAASAVSPVARLLAIPTWAILHFALKIITVSGRIGNQL